MPPTPPNNDDIALPTPTAAPPTPPPPPAREDAVLAINEPYLTQILSGIKSHEFRRYLLPSSIKRIWFYRTSPHSSIEYIVMISPGKTRVKPGHWGNSAGEFPLEETGIGNKEFNSFHEEWEGYDFANEICEVWRLEEEITLERLKGEVGMKAAPRGWMYMPERILEVVGEDWEGKAVKVR
jgi:hypothetical protein